MIPDEAVEAAVEAFLKDDASYCECRHSTLDKHDVNPPCSTRKRVTAQMASALKAALPLISKSAMESLMACVWDQVAETVRDDTEIGQRIYVSRRIRATNPHRSQA